MGSRAGVVPTKGFNKVKAGGDQAFTLQKGTSAAPIMQVKLKPIVKKSKTLVTSEGKVYKAIGNKKFKIVNYPPKHGSGINLAHGSTKSGRMVPKKYVEYAKGGYANKQLRKPQKK